MIEKVIAKLDAELASNFRDGIEIKLNNIIPTVVFNPEHKVKVELWLKHRDISFVMRVNQTDYFMGLLNCLKGIAIQNETQLNHKEKRDELKVYQVDIQENLQLALENTIKYAESLQNE